MAIRVFVTGGTIEGLDNESKPKGKSIIPKLLKEMRVSAECKVEVLMLKDSRLLTEADKELIFEKCRDCKEKQILITHGTWTMPMTAKYLGKNKLPKTIVLVGSMVPAKKKGTDALFNLGFALGAVQALPSGVYIAMNGRIFSWKNVRKNPKKGIFEKEF